MSIGYSFFSGTGSAFMHETLRGLNKEKDFAKIMGKIRSIGYLIPIVLIILAPFLVSVNIKLPFAIALILDIIGLLTVYSFVTPKIKQSNIEEIGATNFKKVLHLAHNIGFLKYALFMGIMSGFLFSLNGYRAAYQSFLQIPIIYYGLFFGLGFALASLISAYSGKIKKGLTLNNFFKLQITIFAVLFFILGITSLQWVIIIIFILFIGLLHGLVPINGSYIMMGMLKNVKFKATLSSIPPQIQKITTAIVALGLGMIIERFSYATGFFIQGIIFCIILIPMYLFIFKNK
jgi:MFS family permease